MPLGFKISIFRRVVLARVTAIPYQYSKDDGNK